MFPQNVKINVSSDSDDMVFLEELMPDWCDPKTESYGLGKKLDQKKFKKLYKIGDNEVYLTVVLRIIYQFFYELKVVSDLQKICFLEDVFTLQNKRFKLEVLKVIVVHWDFNKGSDENNKLRILTNVDESDSDFFKMAFFLLEDLGNRFEDAFDDFLENQRQRYGDFFQQSIVQTLWLFLEILKRKNMNLTIENVFLRCPFIDYNSTILSTFKETQNHRKFVKVKPCTANDEVKVALTSEKRDEIMKNLSNFKKLSKASANDLKSKMFDSRIQTNDKYEPNDFERILATPETEELINLVFNVFKLWQKGFILNQVRMKLPAVDKNCFALKFLSFFLISAIQVEHSLSSMLSCRVTLKIFTPF